MDGMGYLITKRIILILPSNPRPQGSCVITQWVSSTGSVRLLLPEEEEDPSPGAEKIWGYKTSFFGGGGGWMKGKMMI